MEVHESVEIDVPLEQAWPHLRDVQVVAACLPGAYLEEGEHEDGAYRGRLDVRFGPTVTSFAGRAHLEFDDETRSVDIRGRGQDARGRTRAAVDVKVQAHEAGVHRSLLVIDGNIDVVGALERFAASGGVHLARELMSSFADNLATHLEAMNGAARHGEDDATSSDVPHPDGDRDDGSSAVATPPADRAAGRAAPRQRPLSAWRLVWRSLLRWIRRRP